MNHYSQIASRVLNTPLLLEPGYARVFFSALASRLGIQSLADAQGEVLTGDKLRLSAASFASSRERERPYQVIDGAAVIPVSGTLVHKYGYLRPYSGMTGYDGIIARAADAFGDPEVKGVLMDYDTPGGEVAGCFDTARALRSMADEAGKPLWALCYDMNCSAGMALAASAHRRLITQTGVAGSVGVIMAHASYEQQLQEEGVAVTLIHSGARKADGNPYQDLPAEVLANFQQSTDQLRQEFAALVSQFTGLDIEAVLATEAATYRGQAAIDIGFADALVNGHDAIAEFIHYLSTQGRVISLGASMKDDAPHVGAEAPDTVAPAAAGTEQHPAAQAVDEAATARTEERARIAAIIGHDNAEGREQLAEHLAFKTAVSVDEAAAMLAAAPSEQAASLDASTALDALMANEQQPNIGADVGEQEESVASRMLANYRAAVGQSAANH